MATRPSRTKARSNHGPTIFWIIVVTGLIVATGYFGFIDTGNP